MLKDETKKNISLKKERKKKKQTQENLVNLF